jgi:hypothetical protein
MNFLQLCQATALDSGTVAGVPNFTSVEGATGRVAQVVGWVRDAYIDIQNERGDWRWMHKRFTAALTIGENRYSAATLGVPDLRRWLGDIPALGWSPLSLYEVGKKEQEGALHQIEYMSWVERYARGQHDANKPTEWAVSPQNELLVGPTPDKAYLIAGEYRAKPQVLQLDGDVPEMPEDYHRLIIAEAIRLMARSDEAFNVLAEKAQMYDRLRQPLVNDQTPDIDFGGGSLA